MDVNGDEGPILMKKLDIPLCFTVSLVNITVLTNDTVKQRLVLVGGEHTMGKAPMLVLNRMSTVAPYEQISAQIRTLIVSDQLHPGHLLPSIRQLARDLNVAPNTVVRAYNELEQEGFVVISARRGVIVAEASAEQKVAEKSRQLKQLVADFLIGVKQLGVSIDEAYQEMQRQAETSLHTPR
jgi:GntR family transcriptional regulator